MATKLCVFLVLVLCHAVLGAVNPCQKKSTVADNFDEKEFSGTWYTLYHTYLANENICYIDDYEWLSDKTLKLKTSRLVTATGQRENNTGVVQRVGNVLHATITRKRKPDYTVYITDYINYAFIGMCRKSSYLGWLAFKEKVPSEDALDAADDGLSTYGLSIDDLYQDCSYENE